MPPRSKQPRPEAPQEAPARRPERRRTPRRPQQVDVVCVLVAHDGAEWLPDVLAALEASTRAPRRVVCVDTGSTDGSADLLREAYGEVLELPRTTGFGEAVAAALGTLPEDDRAQWVWLLHDDVAVEPDALDQLLAYAESSSSAALVGPKVRDWHDPRYLVEVGITTDAAGHRETGLDPGERDQGQHDAVRDVLAVGTAGALVRRDVWDQVGGLDPHLPLFRDDLDLGWKVNAAGHRVVVVPEARVRHVRAATTGHRNVDAARGRAAGIDRRNALFVLLAHAGPLRVLSLLPRLVLATVLRSVVLLLTRQAGAAADEWRALLGVLAHARLLHRARQARASSRTLSQRELRPLFVSRWVRIRSRLGAVAEWLAGGGAAPSAFGSLGDPGPEGTDAYDELPPQGPGLLRSLLLRPGVLLFLGLTGVALLAERSVLGFHGGSLHGGALLAPPQGAADLWSAYTSAWHEVSVGTRAASPPFTAAMGALSTLLLGKPWVAVDVLLLGSVPLAGLSAYLAATRLVRDLRLRLWAAATWALTPVATGAIASGRLDVAALQVVLPLLALAVASSIVQPPSARGWWRTWALGLALSVAVAFAPLLWPLALGPLLLGAVVLLRRGARLHALSLVVAGLVPLALLFPWSVAVLGRPSLLVEGQAAGGAVPAWHLPLLSPGGPGLPPAVVGAGLLVGALGGLLRREFRGLAQLCWAVALGCLLAAAVLARVEVDGHPLWPGVPLQVAALALLVCCLVAGRGARQALAGHSFGWRQVLAAGAFGLAAVTPLAAAGAWVARGADEPLRRGSTQLLPAFAAAEVAESPGVRALALSVRPDGRLSYDLLRGGGRTLDEYGVLAQPSQQRQLDLVVADLASPRGSDAAEALATRAVRYVVLRPGSGSDEVAAALDAQPGLVRRTAGDVALWRVVAPGYRLSVLPPPLAEVARSDARAPTAQELRTTPPAALAAGPESADAKVPPGQPGRLLVLADAREGGWHARLDGRPLRPTTAWGWAQAFELPAEGGDLELRHAQRGRRTALAFQLAALAVVALLAVPGRRRRSGLEDDVTTDDAVEPERRGGPA